MNKSHQGCTSKGGRQLPSHVSSVQVLLGGILWPVLKAVVPYPSFKIWENNVYFLKCVVTIFFLKFILVVIVIAPHVSHEPISHCFLLRQACTQEEVLVCLSQSGTNVHWHKLLV